VCLSKNQKDKKASGIRNGLMGILPIMNSMRPDLDSNCDNNVEKIDGILFTHEKTFRYTAGIDDIRPFLGQGDIPIYAH